MNDTLQVQSPKKGKRSFQRRKVFFHTLKFVGHNAVIPGFFQGFQAAADGNHAMTRHGTPQVGAVPGREPALPRIFCDGGLIEEVNPKHVEGIGGGDRYGMYRQVIGA